MCGSICLIVDTFEEKTVPSYGATTMDIRAVLDTFCVMKLLLNIAMLQMLHMQDHIRTSAFGDSLAKNTGNILLQEPVWCIQHGHTNKTHWRAHISSVCMAGHVAVNQALADMQKSTKCHCQKSTQQSCWTFASDCTTLPYCC